MKMIIDRTSNNDDKAPCEEAYKSMVEIWDTRKCTEDYFNKNLSSSGEGEWKSKGTKHKITNEGYITRLIGHELVWWVDIKSLSHLLSFVKKYGEIIILKDNQNKSDKELFKLEIYDDYRE